MKPFKFLNRNNNDNPQFQGLLPFFSDTLTRIYDHHIEKILENTRGVSWYGYRSYFLNDVSYLTIHDIEHTPEYVMVGCRIIRDRDVTLYNKFYSPELFGELTGESCRF